MTSMNKKNAGSTQKPVRRVDCVPDKENSADIRFKRLRTQGTLL